MSETIYDKLDMHSIIRAHGSALPGTLSVISGRPKSKKTWILLAMAVEDIRSSGKRIAFVSSDLKPLSLMKRAASMYASVSPMEAINGELDREDLVRFKSAIAILVSHMTFANSPDFHSVSLEKNLLADADVIYVDNPFWALRVLDDAQSAILAELAHWKRYAVDDDIPVIAALHAERNPCKDILLTGPSSEVVDHHYLVQLDERRNASLVNYRR